MRIYGQKFKQIKNGVYKFRRRGEIIVSDYHFSLPLNSIVVPDRNLVFTSLYKGCFAWKYTQCRDTWVMWRLAQTNGKDMDITDAVRIIDKKAADMIVEKNEGNKALVMIPSKIDGKTVMTIEWRYYTYFFRDIIRNNKCGTVSNTDI